MRSTKSICASNYLNSNWATTTKSSSSVKYHKHSLDTTMKTFDKIILNRSLQNNFQMAFNCKMEKNQRQYSCTFCPFICTWLYDLKIHLKQKHKILK